MEETPARFIHPSADVEPEAQVGAGTRVWHRAHIRNGARVGRDCIVGGGVFIDTGVVVGDRVKIQNAALLYHGVRIADGVFIGPRVTFTNDLHPRAVNPDGSLKDASDWVVTSTWVETGASLGAASVIVAGVTIGAWALVGAGSVVSRDVPAQALVLGVPARQAGWACLCGRRLVRDSKEDRPRSDGDAAAAWSCPNCGQTFALADLPALA